MKTFKTTLLAAASVAVMATAAQAGMNDAVIDDRGSNLTNTWDNCVITKWDGGTGCHTVGKDLKTIFFDFNSSALSATEQAKLRALAASVKKAHMIESVSIVGYADKIGGTDYNVALSQKRADAVRSFLAALGVNVAGATVNAMGEAENESCDGLERLSKIRCLANDRRVEVVLNTRN